MSQKETVFVTIDSNEVSQKPELVEALTLHEDVNDHRIKPMDEGDIEIEGMLFERKTPSDFASSLEEGRLREQVERMSSHDKRAFILVEGNMEDFENLTHTNIPSKSLRGMDASIEMKNGVGVKYCSHIYGVADMAVRLARKGKEGVKTVQTKQTNAIKDATFMEEVFHSIEGIGIDKSERLAKEFPNLTSLVDAEMKDFEEVKGIGDKLAEEIINTVHQKEQGGNPTKKKEKSKKVYTI